MKTISEQILETIEEVSGGSWFKKNAPLLQEKINVILAQGATDGTPATETDNTELESVRASLQETIAANTTLNESYQEAHKVLIDLGTLVIGGAEKLREHVPLTVDKLHAIIDKALTAPAAGDQTSVKQEILAWVRLQQKNLVIIGHGPLASGRHEGAHDILTQLIARLSR